jgi:hypothetical protein
MQVFLSVSAFFLKDLMKGGKIKKERRSKERKKMYSVVETLQVVPELLF